MTAQKLFGTLKFLDEIDRVLSVQNILDSIRNHMDSLVAQPAQPQFQQALANSIKDLRIACTGLSEKFTPARLVLLNEIGGAEFFDHNIADRFQSAISSNAMTPSVARDFIQEFTTRRANFLQTVRKTIQGLEALNLKEGQVEAGSADLAFLIPRELFKNHLGPFAKELGFINQMIRDFSEAVTGEPEDVVLETLSSSTPTIAVMAGVPVILALGRVIVMFLDGWKKVEDIREIRAKLSKLGLKDHAEALTGQITTTVETVVEESTEFVIASYPGDPARKNELENAVHQHSKRLFGQIERGLTVEFRAEPDEDGPNADALDQIHAISKSIEFPRIAVDHEPLLLPSGDVIEDPEIKTENAGTVIAAKRTKKTTKTTTTTRDKEPSSN